MGKRKQASAKIRVTERDTGIFLYIGRRGAVPYNLIKELFWREAKDQTCIDRLMKLVKGGFLGTEVTNARGRSEQIFYVTKKGGRLFSNAIRDSLFLGPPPKGELAHTLDAADILQIFRQQNTLLSFQHEHELKSEKIKAIKQREDIEVADMRITTLASDAIPVPEGTHLIEIHGKYYGKRLSDKITALGSSKEHVYWVVRGGDRQVRNLNAKTKGYENITVLAMKRVGDIMVLC